MNHNTIQRIREAAPRIFLALLVLDPALGFDVWLADRPEQVGVLTGYVVSVGTLTLVPAYLLWWVDRRRVRFHLAPWFTLPQIVLLLATLYAGLSVPDRVLGLTSTFLLIQLILIFLYLVNHVRSRSDLNFVLVVWCVCLGLGSALMIGTYATATSINLPGLYVNPIYDPSASLPSGIRAGSPIGGPNASAVWLAVSLALATGFFLASGRYWVLIPMAMGHLALVFTWSRTSWIGMAACLVTMALLIWRRRPPRRLVWALAGIVLVVWIPFSGSVLQRFVGDDDRALADRFPLMATAVNMILDNPLTGIGANAFNDRMREFLPPETANNPIAYVHVVHNKYLLLWAELGLVGILSFLALLAVASALAARGAWRASDPDRWIDAALLGGLVACGLGMLAESFAGRALQQVLWWVVALVAVRRILETKRVRTA